MIPYILSLIPIVFFVNWKKNEKIYKCALIIWLLSLVLLAGLRGNITSDFIGYKNIFINYQGYHWDEIIQILNLRYNFTAWEIGYVFINFLISRITDDYMWVQIVIAIITYGCIFHYAKQSKDPVISILSFLSIGCFLEGFNTVRNVMAACICALAIQYIEKRNFIKYLLVIVIASMFHSTALLMIPFYFILDRRPTIKIISLYAAGSGLLLIFLDSVAVILNNIFFFSTTSSGILEMLYKRQYSFGVIFFSVAFSLFCLSMYYLKPNYYLGEEARKEIILVNGVIIWFLIRLFMLVVGYAERFAEFFSVYIILLLPMQLEKFNPKSRNFLKIIFALIMIGYYLYASQSLYGSYQTIL